MSDAAPVVTPTTDATPAPAAPTTAAPASPPAPTIDAAPKAADTAAPTPSLLADKAPDAPKPNAPIIFDATKLTLPEGWKAEDETSKATITKFTEIMNEPDAQKRGQSILNLYAEQVKTATEAASNVAKKYWSETHDQWVKEVKADPEVGGDKLESTKQSVAKMIDSLGPDRAEAVRQALNLTGAGNHPAIVRAFAHFAKSLNEGGHIVGTPPAGAKSIAETFFPNSPGMK